METRISQFKWASVIALAVACPMGLAAPPIEGVRGPPQPGILTPDIKTQSTREQTKIIFSDGPNIEIRQEETNGDFQKTIQMPKGFNGNFYYNEKDGSFASGPSAKILAEAQALKIVSAGTANSRLSFPEAYQIYGLLSPDQKLMGVLTQIHSNPDIFITAEHIFAGRKKQTLEQAQIVRFETGSARPLNDLKVYSLYHNNQALDVVVLVDSATTESNQTSLKKDEQKLQQQIAQALRQLQTEIQFGQAYLVKQMAVLSSGDLSLQQSSGAISMLQAPERTQQHSTSFYLPKTKHNLSTVGSSGSVIWVAQQTQWTFAGIMTCIVPASKFPNELESQEAIRVVTSQAIANSQFIRTSWRQLSAQSWQKYTQNDSCQPIDSRGAGGYMDRPDDSTSQTEGLATEFEQSSGDGAGG